MTGFILRIAMMTTSPGALPLSQRSRCRWEQQETPFGALQPRPMGETANRNMINHDQSRLANRDLGQQEMTPKLTLMGSRDESNHDYITMFERCGTVGLHPSFSIAFQYNPLWFRVAPNFSSAHRTGELSHHIPANW